MPDFCDLHAHSIYSDGALTPSQLVKAARRAELSALALTDHDTTDGLPEAFREGKRRGVEIVPGIELSSRDLGGKEEGPEMHILGYFIDPPSPALQDELRKFRRERRSRVKRILEKLAERGMPLGEGDIQNLAGKKSVGRPHIARALVRRGHVGSVAEAFRKFLGEGRAAFVPRAGFDARACIDMIHQAGGVAVLAHPRFGGPVREEDWDRLASFGLDGLEAHHAQHTPSQAKSFEKIASGRGWLVTGGSDFHEAGPGPSGRLGGAVSPRAVLEAMKDMARARRRG